MARLTEVKAPEQWIVEVNGSYDIMFSSVTLAADAVDGEVISEGIVSGGGLTGEIVRVMVRGNPSKVKADALTGATTGLDDSIILV